MQKAKLRNSASQRAADELTTDYVLRSFIGDKIKQKRTDYELIIRTILFTLNINFSVLRCRYNVIWWGERGGENRGLKKGVKT